MIDIDISRLTPQERLDLIGRLWDSLDANDLPLTQAQARELDWRLAQADSDLAHSVPWATVRAEVSDRFK